MAGDGGVIRIIDDVEYVVCWNGTLDKECLCPSLLPDRPTRVTSSFWTPPKRLYNKKSEYWTKGKKQDVVVPDVEEATNGEPMER